MHQEQTNKQTPGTEVRDQGIGASAVRETQSQIEGPVHRGQLSMNGGYKPEDFEQERVDVNFAGFILGGICGFALGALVSPYLSAFFA